LKNYQPTNAKQKKLKTAKSRGENGKKAKETAFNSPEKSFLPAQIYGF